MIALPFGVKIHICVRATSERQCFNSKPPYIYSGVGTPPKCLFFLSNRNGFSAAVSKTVGSLDI
jgi:UDP-N-acetyl-D-mannosaminuronic acid transferase (WecB/TagA/CpsF family)